MCTKKETAEVLEHEFFKEGGLKDRLMKSFKLELDAELGKFTRTQIAALVGVVVIFAGLFWQVNANTTELNNRANIIDTVDVIEFKVGQNADTLRSIDDRLREAGI